MKKTHKTLWSVIALFIFFSCKNPYSEATYDGLIPMTRIISDQFTANRGGYKVYLNPNDGTIAFNGAEFEVADFFSCGLAYIIDAKRENRRKGFIDQNNNLIIDCSKFLFVSGFSDDRAVGMNFNREYNIIDTSGKSILTLSAEEWTPLTGYKDGISIWKHHENWNWATIDKQGNIRHFTDCYPASGCYPAHNLLCVWDTKKGNSSKFGAINLKTGKMAIPFIFDNKFIFDRSGYAVILDDQTRQFGLIDTKGNYTMQPQYKSIEPDGDDLYKCKTELRCFWTDHNGKEFLHIGNDHIDESIFFFCGRKQFICFDYNPDEEVYEFILYTKKSGKNIFKTPGGAYLVYPPVFRNGNGIANYHAGRYDHRCLLVDKDFNPIGNEEFHISNYDHMWNQDDNMAKLQLFYTYGIPYVISCQY